jgi:hypothetical protein
MRPISDLPSAQPSPRIFAPAVQAALQLLGEAHGCAVELNKDPWQFGLEWTALEAAGLTHSQVRWLLCQGYVHTAVETTSVRAKQRTFRAVASLTLTGTSCFNLTANGIDLIRALGGPPLSQALQTNSSHPSNGQGLPAVTFLGAGTAQPPPSPYLPSRNLGETHSALKPRWLADQLELRLGDCLVKKFRRPADSQTTILAVFEEEAWPYRIDNPLPPTRHGNDMDRLQEALRRLNHHQHAKLLRFHGDGRGKGVTWEIAR